MKHTHGVIAQSWCYVGIALLTAACSSSSSDGVSSLGAQERDAEALPDAADEPEDAGEPDVNVAEPDAEPVELGCVVDPDAEVVEHGDTITADETWGPGPHLITFQTSVRTGATLTIEPCAVVRVRAGQGIDIWDGGAIVAEGTAVRPIRFEPAPPSDRWSVFQVNAGASLALAYTTISGAGETNDVSAGALSLRGTLDAPVARVRHVTIEAAPHFGVRLDPGATFTEDSTDLTITDSAAYPVITHPDSAGSLPSGSYTGNAYDEILVYDGIVQHDMTLRDLGVPYHVGRPGSRNTSLRVAAAIGQPLPAAVPLLTIEADVTLRFEPEAIMEVEHYTGPMPATGALRVAGTEGHPVVFTSASDTPAAGDWKGIWFGGVPDPRDAIDHARVEYAGGVAGAQNFSCDNPGAPQGQQNRNQGAIVILGLPSESFVDNTVIAHSAGDGISRGYSGAPIDFVAANTFEDVAWCLQSYPRPTMGACPSVVPCPR